MIFAFLVPRSRVRPRLKRGLPRSAELPSVIVPTFGASKYFGKSDFPIFVRYDNHYSAPSFIPLEQCTEVFQRYSEKRSITRLYVSPENYALCRNQGRGAPLRFEDYEDEERAARATN